MSIVNEKASELVQLEFQNLGTSSSNTMLIQPLLEHASTYNCHLMNLHTALGDSAVPGGLKLFKISVSPFVRYEAGSGADLVALGAESTNVKMKNIFHNPLQSKTYDNAMYFDHLTWIEQAEKAPDVLMQDMIGRETVTHKYGIHDVHTHTDFAVPFTVTTPEHCVSSLDLIWSIQEQLRKISGEVNKYLGKDGTTEFADRNWGNEAVPHSVISLTTNLRGQLGLRVSPDFFRAGFMIMFSDFWRKLTGDTKLFAMCMYEVTEDGGLGYAGSPKYIYNTDELNRLSEITPSADDKQPLGFMNCVNVMQSAGGKKANDLPPLDMKFGDNIFELADFRKQLVLDVTLPIDSTLRWNTDEPEIRHQLQEFELNPGEFEGHVNIGGSSIIEQRQYVGDRVILNNAHSLSVKKLFEGQMQAVRLELLLRSLKWEPNKRELNESLEPVEFDRGEFFYTKLVFCKEVV